MTSEPPRVSRTLANILSDLISAVVCILLILPLISNSSIIIIIIIILLFTTFRVVVFHCSLGDGMSHRVVKILFCILSELYNAVVSTVSILPVPFPNIWGPFQAYLLQSVPPSSSCSTAFSVLLPAPKLVYAELLMTTRILKSPKLFLRVEFARAQIDKYIYICIYIYIQFMEFTLRPLGLTQTHKVI